MIEQLPVIIGIVIIAGALAAVCIWVELTDRRFKRLIEKLLKKQKS